MSNTRELIDAASRAIGEGDKSKDWKIVPSEHAELLENKAPSLAEVLRGSLPKGLTEMYEELNDKAIKARDDFKHTVSKANYAVFCAASLGALLLVAFGLRVSLGEAAHWVIGAIGFCGLISGGLATMWITRARGGRLAHRWAQERARAEAKRLAYFKAIIGDVSDQPYDQLLALEYTRRFLLDNQLDYFGDRGSQHEDSADTALKKSTLAVFVASTATAVAGLLSIFKPQLAIVAGLGVVASAYSALAASRSGVNRDRRNADSYRLAYEQLRDRKLMIDAYREKAASGDKQAVAEFFEPIFVTLATDHKEFLDDVEQREIAIGAMEERLGAATDALGKKPAGTADDSK